MSQQHHITYIGLRYLLVMVIGIATLTFILLLVYPVVLVFWYIAAPFNLIEALCWLELDRRKSSDMLRQEGLEKRPKTEYFGYSRTSFLAMIVMLLAAVAATKSTLPHHIILISPWTDGIFSLVFIWMPLIWDAYFTAITIVSIRYLQNYLQLTNTSVVGSQTKMSEGGT